MSSETAETTCATSTPVTPTKTPAPGSNQNTPSKETDEAMNQLVQGKRHLLVKDYTSAVTTLGKACELLAVKFGDTAPECGDAYLCYGKALLELARTESGVLEMNESDKGEESDEEGDGDGDADGEEGDADDADEADAEKDAGGDEKVDAETKKTSEDVEKKGDKESEKDLNGDSDKKVDSEEKGTNGDVKEATGKESNGDVKEANGKESNGDVEETDGDASKTEANGDADGKMGAEEGKDDCDKADKVEDEEDVNNLQLSWEMLELAKVIFQKQREAGEKQAAVKLAEVYLKLGEVGVESENYSTAIEDMKACLAIQREILDEDDRRIAETLYNMGMAYSLNSEFDAAIEQFKEASAQIERRISTLEKKKGEPVPEKKEGDDAFYTVEGEITELKALLPEMKDKITDMHDFKKETMRRMMESLAEESAKMSSTTDGAGPSSAESKPEKPVSSISHLVKRKPKDGAKDEKTEPTKETKESPAIAKTDEAEMKSFSDADKSKDARVSEKVKETKDEVKDVAAETKEAEEKPKEESKEAGTESKEPVEEVIKEAKVELKDEPMEEDAKSEAKKGEEITERKRKPEEEEEEAATEVAKKAKVESDVKSD